MRKQIIKSFFIFLLFGGGLAFAENEDLNKVFSFKRIKIGNIKDNVDGAFKSVVEKAYKEVFERNPRFELVKETDSADSTIKTEVEKKLEGTFVQISLSIDSTGEVFTVDKTTIKSSANDIEIRAAIRDLLKTSLLRIPFFGTITGRDEDELTFDIGGRHGLKPGDLIQIARVDQVKKHPLLRSVVDIQLVVVGRAVIDVVEDSISFGHVHSEVAGEKIQRLHKVTSIEGSVVEQGENEKKAEEKSKNRNLIIDTETNQPQFGFLGLGFFLGQLSSSSSQKNGMTNVAGAALNYGTRLNGEVWLTKRFFFDGLFSATLAEFSQGGTRQGTTVSGIDGTTSTISYGLNAGYRYLVNGDLYGPQAFLKLGYHYFRWNTQIDETTLLSPKRYHGVNLGVGGTLPLYLLRVINKMGILMNANLVLFSNLKEDGIETGPEDNKSVTAVNFFAGGYYFISAPFAVRAGIQFDSHGASFGTGESTAATNQRQVGFLTSILYYF